MPQDQVDEVKSKVDIVSLLSEYITLKKAGRNYRANCPFHGEKTPSFMVSPELQIYKCFGCGETGDVFTFLEKREGMDFFEALKFLGDRVGVKIVSQDGGQMGEKERLYSLSSMASKFYSYMLLTHPSGKKALDYLTRERGLKMDTLKHFNLGFSPSFSRPLVNLLVNKKKYHADELVKAGLTYFKGRDLVDRFEGRIIFPLYDHRGNIIGFSGRLLPGDPREETSGKYINSPDTAIYHKSKVLYGLNWTKDVIKADKSALVVEGEIDLISLYQAGVRNVVAIKGSALTEEHADLLLRFTDKIILSLDSDIAGNMAARRGIAQAYKKGLEIRVLKLTDYKDPDEAVRKNPDAFRRAMDRAINIWDYLLEETFKKYDLSSGEGKRKVGREVVPILASIEDSIVQAHYIELTAKKLGVPESAVFSEVRRGKPEFEMAQISSVVEDKTPKDRRHKLEEELLSTIFLLDPKLLRDKDTKMLIITPLCKRILEEFEKFDSESKTFNISDFGKTLPRELFPGFSEMVLSLGDDGDTDALEKELLSVKKEINSLDIKEKMEILAKKMATIEGEKDKKGLSEARKEFSLLSKKLIELEEK
jgi:DNA primase